MQHKPLKLTFPSIQQFIGADEYWRPDSGYEKNNAKNVS